MHDWMGIGLMAVGLGLIGAAVIKRQQKLRNPAPADVIRPEFAAMGDIVRPLILFIVAVFALKISAFYFILGGQHYLTPLDFGGILFVLATYSGWLIIATKKPVPARAPIPSGERSTA